MIQPTIRCANPACDCSVSMDTAMRIGTRLYCSFRCANGYDEVTHIRDRQTRSSRALAKRAKTGQFESRQV